MRGEVFACVFISRPRKSGTVTDTSDFERVGKRRDVWNTCVYHHGTVSLWTIHSQAVLHYHPTHSPHCSRCSPTELVYLLSGEPSVRQGVCSFALFSPLTPNRSAAIAGRIFRGSRGSGLTVRSLSLCNYGNTNAHTSPSLCSRIELARSYTFCSHQPLHSCGSGFHFAAHLPE